MTDEDLLTRLPDIAYPTTARPLPSIVERAHEIRRGRRRYALGGLATVAAGLTVLGVWTGIPLPGPGSGSVTPASGGQAADPDAGKDCSTGHAYTAPRDTVGDLLFLPSAQTAGPITGEAIGRRETSNCAYTKPEGIAYTIVDGAVIRRMAVSGPGARNQYDFSASDGSASFGGTTTAAAVGGGTAMLYSMDGSSWIYMFWTAPDGTTWSIQSGGQTRDELITAVGSLKFDRGHLETHQLPTGFKTWAGLPAVSYTNRDRHQYRYVLVPFHDGGASPGWEFEVRDRPSFADAPIGGREVQIGATSGWWSGPGAGGGGKGRGQLTWRVGSAELRLSSNSASLSLQQALDVARSVGKVGVDDARLKAAWEH